MNPKNPPKISAALGTSDHSTVIWKTSKKDKRWNNIRSVRPLRDSNIRRFGSWICEQNWQDIITSKNLDESAELLEKKLWLAYEAFFPRLTYKCKANEPPWMSKNVKLLIRQRDRAHSRHQIGRLEILRKKVRKEVNAAKARWYKRYMERITADCNGSWYRQVSALTCRQFKPVGLDTPATDTTKADIINDFFTQICTTHGPQDMTQLPAYLPANRPSISIQPWQVAHRLSKLREGMAVPPNQLPVRLIKEFSVEMAIPLAHIYNRSIQEGYVPTVWRNATVTPVPKKPSPESPGDLRPISLRQRLARCWNNSLFHKSWRISDLR